MNLNSLRHYTAQSWILSQSIVRVSLVALTAIIAVGCDRTVELINTPANSQASSTVPSGRFTSLSSPAMKLLQECFEAYQSLGSYEDRATVNLSYVYDGESVTDQAPIAVAWDDTGCLGLKVYSVQAGVEHDRWRLRIADGDKALNGQVISRAVPSTLTMQWLLADELAASYLSAGLAGFPPQLDLLLAPEPLQGMLDTQSKITLLDDRVIHGKNCRGISIERDGRTYRLWLSDESKLIHRIDYPREHLPQDILNDGRVSSISLHVDFNAIQINHPINWQRYKVPVESTDQLVQRFLPPPPPVDTSRLGVQVPSFQLLGPDGEVVYRSNASEVARFTVLVWLASHPTSEYAAEQLRQVESRVRGMGIDKSQVDFVNVWAEPKPPQGMSLEQISEQWNLAGQFALDFHAAGRDLFGITEAPSMVVLDNTGKVQIYEERLNPILQDVLPQLLSELCHGVDLASQVTANFNSIQNRFASELDMVRASDDVQTRRQIEPYLPISFDLVEVKKRPASASTVASAIDGNQNLWLLDATGTLTSRSLDDHVNSRIEVEGFKEKHVAKAEAVTGMRLAISSDGRFAGLWEGDQQRVVTIDVKRQSQNQFRLPDQAKLLDIRWVTLPELDYPTLVVLLDNSSVVMLDPITREHLSGQTKSQPVAVCETRGSIGSKPWVVTSDGRVEPLMLEPGEKLGVKSAVSELTTAIGESPETVVTRQLSFRPNVGSWSMAGDGKSTIICATGFVSAEESGLFMLNEKLDPVWQLRFPAAEDNQNHILCSAIDPSSGEKVWIYSADRQTVQVLKQMAGDIAEPTIAIDHFRLAEPMIDAALVAHGEKLLLVIHSKSESVVFELRWHGPPTTPSEPVTPT